MIFPELHTIADIVEYSGGVASFFVMLICLLAVTLVIHRHGWLDMDTGSDISPGIGIPTTAMGQVYNPFRLQLKDQHRASAADGVTVVMTHRCPCWMWIYWGVTIKDIFPYVYQPWPKFVESLMHDRPHLGCIQSRASILTQTGADIQLHLETPDVFELGGPPRTRFPLAVLLIDAEAMEQQGHLHSGQHVVTMVTFIHLKDAECPGESHIIAQYVRTPGGRPYNLQQLYVASDEYSTGTAEEQEESHDAEEAESDDGNQPTPSTSSSMCIVCAVAPVERALLPCRHACVCDSCAQHLTSCPMCRGRIDSYFRLGSMAS